MDATRSGVSLDKPLPVSLPESLADARVSYRLFSGHPPYAPARYGWSVRLGRHTTLAERAWFRAHGFAFGGGAWHLWEG